MGLSKMNIWLRNVNCDLLTTCWRTDLVIQGCTGSYLVDTYPEVIDQLKKRYATPATVSDLTTYPLTDQSGRTVDVTVNGTLQTVTLTAPATTAGEIYPQLVAGLTGCVVSFVDGQITITTDERGPTATLSIGGTSDMLWGPVTQGGGYRILKHYYQNAWRIMLQPPSGTFIQEIEVDVPPGCYKVWTRVCHGNNEETSVSMVGLCCGDHVCVNLILPTIQTCSAQVIHPLMDAVVHDGFLQDDAERLLPFRALMWGAKIGKQDVLVQLNYRKLEAQDKGDAELEARVNAVIALANLLPECY